jgi:acyl-CoA synthetase (AMP-forming)/AMP-acid ligase II
MMYVCFKVEVGMLIVLQVYLNIVLDEALEEKPGGEKVRIGMVVIRGNAVVMLEVRLSRPAWSRWNAN